MQGPATTPHHRNTPARKIPAMRTGNSVAGVPVSSDWPSGDNFTGADVILLSDFQTLPICRRRRTIAACSLRAPERAQPRSAILDGEIACVDESGRPIFRDLLFRRRQLMKRVFAADVLACDLCGGRLRILATICPPETTRKIRDHLGLPSRAPPLAPPAFQELPFAFE